MPFSCFKILLFCIVAVSATARMPDYQAVSLAITTNAGWGTNVYVTGDAVEFGNGDLLQAVKLRWTEGNVWTGRVALRKGAVTGYQFVLRDGAASRFCDPENRSALNATPLVTGRRISSRMPGKIIYYYTGWTGATLVVQSETNQIRYPMSQVGPGRAAGEWLYRVSRVESMGSEITFSFEGWNGEQHDEDLPPEDSGYASYRTALDNFVVQDGGVYSYWPAGTVSPPRIEPCFVTSTVEAVTGRGIRIYLPRGYDAHADRRYPVVYFQDGTNVFSPGGAFGSWDADLAASREIAMGRMRESILVAIDNTPLRRTEYNPHGDTYPGEAPGSAHQYLQFVVQDVMTHVNDRYRTLPGAVDQVVAGSSMGGIFSVYAVFATNRFGSALAMSPSFTRAPVFTSRIPLYPKPDARIYIDTGNEEGMIGPAPGGDYWDSVWNGYDLLLDAGFIPGDDLLMRIGCSHGHNEAAWRERLPEAFRFLLNPLVEPVMAERVTFSEEAPTH